MNDLIETRSIDYVPLGERHGKAWHLWSIWFTGNAQLATLATGVIGIALGLDIVWSCVAIVLGCALGTIFMASHSIQGPQLGLPQMIQSRPQFGAMGALLVYLVALITFVGYNAFNQLLAAQSLHQLAGVSPHAGMLGFTMAAVVVAVAGYDWIHVAQRWVAWLMVAALVIFTLGAPWRLHLPKLMFGMAGLHPTAFLSQFFAAASYQLTWSIYVSDYSRYLPRTINVRASFWWTFCGSLLGGAWMMLVGMMVAAAFPHADVAGSVVAAGDALRPGFGAVLLGASLCGLVTSTSINYYGASLTLLSIADTVRPLRATAAKRVAAILATTLVVSMIALRASDDAIGHLNDLLAVLLYLFTPWTAINLVDFYIVRKGHYSVREIFNPTGMYGRWNWRGLGAYAAGFVAMIPFFSTGLYTGPVARALQGADIAMLVGLPVSAIVYLLACRFIDVAADRRMAAAADIGLDAESR